MFEYFIYYQIISCLATVKDMLSTDNIGVMSMLSDQQQSSSRNSRTGSSYCSRRSKSKSCNRVTVVGVILIFIFAVLLSPQHQATVQVVTASSPPPPTSSLSSTSIMKTISGGAQIQNDDDSIDVNVNNNENDNDNNNEICIIFSDLDGTLIHYPSSDSDNKEDRSLLSLISSNNNKKDVSVLNLPKSSSGLSGIISAQTLCSIRTIRNGNCGGIGGSNKVTFVLISGMRTSTFLQRLPYLPKADAYATENGGRIFYPLPVVAKKDDDDNNTFRVKPKRFKGSTKDDLLPFGIFEDMDWKKKMINTKALGGSGNGDDGDFTLNQILNDPSGSQKQLKERDGLLWDFARDLIHNKHFILDTTGYSTCFRVNRKHQNNQNNNNSNSNNNESDDVQAPPSQLKFKFEDLYNGKFLNQPPWIDDNDNIDNNNENNNSSNDNVIGEDGHVILSESIQSKISWSVNLNCVDFYPSISGKKIASKFFPERCGGYNRHTSNSEVEGDVTATTTTTTVPTAAALELFLSKHSICLCDDDNDLEMALACQHAYLPDISSQSMMDITQKYPKHFTIPFATTTTTSTTTNDDNDKNDGNNNHDDTDDTDDTDDGPTSVVKKGTTEATDLALSMIMERLKLRRFDSN